MRAEPDATVAAMLRRAFVLALFAGLVATIAAGCGGSGGPPKPFAAQATAACLKQKGFTGITTKPSKIGFIAAFADGGGLLAHSPDGSNTVVIAFAGDTPGAAATKQAYRHHAPKGLHINDVMSSRRNAVLVWTVTPSTDLQTLVLGCLKS